VTRLADDSRIGKVKLKNLEEHSAATVFTQNPSSHHLLAVACDAQTVDLYRPEQVWRDLSFDHIGASDRGGTYSYLTIAGDQRRIAAPATSHWANQLLLPVYNYQASEANPQGPSRTTNAGLIGRLPLLLALAVFTCPESVLAQVLIVCMQPGAWRKHQWTFPEGREFWLPTPQC